MVRTEWLNMSIKAMDAIFSGQCNCKLARHLVDLRDTAAEASARQHATRSFRLFMLIRRAEAGCPGEGGKTRSPHPVGKRGPR